MALKHLTAADFDAAVNSVPLAMVDFWAPWCGPCKMLGPTVEALAQRYEGRALIAKVNVDEESELARRFRVMSIPTVLFMKNGTVLERKVGLMDEAEYTALLDANL